MKSTGSFARSAGSFAFACALAACGGGDGDAAPTPASICEAAAACDGTDGADLSECTTPLDDLGELARDKGCADDYDAYLACLDAAVDDCNSGGIKTCSTAEISACVSAQ